jgi:hypothetical protein
MPGDPFDLKKIRRNWQLAGALGDDQPQGRIAAVPAPLDPFVAARHDLTRLRELLASQFEEHSATLAPFTRRIDEAISRLEQVTAARSQDDPAALRAELEDALFDLEDLLEVFSLPRRR